MSRGLPLQYFTIVPREEVFGSGDTGTKTVIRLIAIDGSTYKELLPPPDASIEDKQEYEGLKNTLEGDDFTECAKSGYFEYKKPAKENEIKSLMESLGFHEYD